VVENELNKLDFGQILRFLRKIVEGYPICPVTDVSDRRQNNVAIPLYFTIVHADSASGPTKKMVRKTYF
jgi:hypothetical protein